MCTDKRAADVLLHVGGAVKGETALDAGEGVRTTTLAFPPGRSLVILRKEVIQPQVLLRLPCYDLVPIIELTFGAFLPRVGSATSGAPDSRGLTGGVYKAQEHIHRGVLIRDY